jgi:hypothetical protein
MQKLTAASFLLIASCFVLRAQEPAATPKKTDEPATGVIDGKVVNESGQPMAGAGVFIRAVNSQGNARTAFTDVDGNFRISGLEPALYVVTSNAPAYTSVPTDPATPTYYRIGDTIRIELIRGGVITGTVTNSVGEPVVAVRVRAVLVRDARGEIPKFTPFGINEQATDDRGIYRIYGLRPGSYIVSAGGAGFSPTFNPYDGDMPTYAPSTTRDNAAEVAVRSGEDSTMDIRYRGESGHTISGTAKVVGQNGASITLAPAGSPAPLANTFQSLGGRGFAFSGLGDGDYDLVAQEVTSTLISTSTMPSLSVSEPKRVSVRGADVTGIELSPRPLGSISGKIALESSKDPECQGKRPPLLAETFIRLQKPDPEKEDWLYTRIFVNSASPDASGAFVIRNLAPNKYQFEPRFYARYWYLQSITTTTAAAKPQKIDAAANWTTLKSGEQIANVTITLAQGAASISGRVPVAEGAAIPAGTSVFLVPAEPDKADDVLRYFMSEVGADQTFTFNNLPPGKYLALIDTQSTTLTKLRQPEGAPTRTKLRRSAEAKKNDLELKPCQTVADFQPKP